MEITKKLYRVSKSSDRRIFCGSMVMITLVLMRISPARTCTVVKFIKNYFHYFIEPIMMREQCSKCEFSDNEHSEPFPEEFILTTDRRITRWTISELATPTWYSAISRHTRAHTEQCELSICHAFVICFAQTKHRFRVGKLIDYNKFNEIVRKPAEIIESWPNIIPI